MNGRNKTIFGDIFIGSSMEDDGEFIPLISGEDEEEMKNVEVPEVLPVLSLKNTVLFPGVVIPISVGRNKSLSLVKEVYQGDKILGGLISERP